jgi:hypothetical protein
MKKKKKKFNGKKLTEEIREKPKQEWQDGA